MRWFNPHRSEVERAWIAHRGRELAALRGWSEAHGQSEAMRELAVLIESGCAMPWTGTVTRFVRQSPCMCGLYSMTTPAESVRKLFSEDWLWQYPGDLEPSDKLGPSAKTPGHASNNRLVVRRSGDAIEFASLRWRYEMKWMREKRLRVPINAKSETMFNNGMFKYSAKERRCLIIADGFYEPKGPKGTKREQYLFAFPERRVFALGGIWTHYEAEDDAFDGFAICTTRPNDQVGQIHERMPIILTNEQEWLDWLCGTQEDAMRLCEPIERPELSAERVS